MNKTAVVRFVLYYRDYNQLSPTSIKENNRMVRDVALSCCFVVLGNFKRFSTDILHIASVMMSHAWSVFLAYAHVQASLFSLACIYIHMIYHITCNNNI